MSITEIGRDGETWAREWILSNREIGGAWRGDSLFQADWIVQARDGSYFLVEVKHQEVFVPPPFFGHGLPPYQVEARLRFYRATGIPTLLLVRDAESGSAFWQWLDVLDSLPDDEKFYTNGAKPRVVYPLSAFEGGEI